eukprot:jgi/Antlo1/2050/636
MTFCRRIVSISSRDKPWQMKIALYENASMLSSENFSQLLENISEGLDHGKNIDVDTLLRDILKRVHTNNKTKVCLLNLALKASNFVQKLMCNLLKMKFQEKHRLNISQNFYFNTRINTETIEKVIAFAKENINSSCWDVKLRSHCLLELFGVKGKRDENILLFVSYVFSRNEEDRNKILLTWSKKVKKTYDSEAPESAAMPDCLQQEKHQIACTPLNTESNTVARTNTASNLWDICMDLEPLFIPKILLSEFFTKEMQHIRNYDVVEKVLVNLKSHKVVYGLFNKVFMQEKKGYGYLGSILTKTFRVEDIVHTKAIFQRLFAVDEIIAETTLKRFIVETGCTAMSRLFYMRCKIIDGRYIESCIICRDSIDILGEKVRNLVKSHYLPFLTMEYDMFEKIVLILERVSFPLESAVPYLFTNQDTTDEKIFAKLLFLLQRCKDTKHAVLSIFHRILKGMQKRMESEICTLSARETGVILLRDGVVTIFFKLVSAMRSFSEMDEFIGLFIHIDCAAFLDILLPCDGRTVVDTFLVRSLNKIHEYKQWLGGIYKLIQSRLLSSSQLHLDDYWCAAARKQIKINVNDIVGTSEDALHNNVLDKNCYSFVTSAHLITHLVSCKTPLICPVQIALDCREKYKEGLALNDSFIRIKVETGRVCVYGIFYQYGTYGSYKLFSLVSSHGEKLCLGITGGVYFIQSIDGARNSGLLLLGSAESAHRRKVAIEVYGSSVILHSCLGKSNFRIRDVAEVVVGECFKGVVSRLVLHDSFGYSENLLDEMGKCEYFLQRLRFLEKKLAYADGYGVYMDSCRPYHLTRKQMEVSFSNVMYIRNSEWRENRFVKERLDMKECSC